MRNFSNKQYIVKLILGNLYRIFTKVILINLDSDEHIRMDFIDFRTSINSSLAIIENVYLCVVKLLTQTTNNP